MIPSYTKQIMRILIENDHRVYLVGGAVRDILLMKQPKDYDIATSATPDQVKKLFDKVVPTGEKHGTVTVINDGEHCEVTTFRIEGKYSDSRRPDEVRFTVNIEDDLARRDFTINAMAMGINGDIIDPFGGRDDIQSKIIRAVSNPDDRFKEDPLRMLRAIRQAAQLDFGIEDGTFSSIKRNSYLIQNISKERIRDEFCKMIVCTYPTKSINRLRYTNLLHFIVPEVIAGIDFDQMSPYHDKTIYDHTMAVLDASPNNLVTRLGALFHDIAKPWTFSVDEASIGHFYGHVTKGVEMTEETMRRLKFDNNKITRVKILVKEHMSKYPDAKKSTLKKFIQRVGVENLENLFDLQIADIKGQSNYKYSEMLQEVSEMEESIKQILAEKEPMSVKDLAVNGRDLMGLGLEGKEIGTMLNKLLEYVLEDSSMNEKGKMLEIANSTKKEFQDSEE